METIKAGIGVMGAAIATAGVILYAVSFVALPVVATLSCIKYLTH